MLRTGDQAEDAALQSQLTRNPISMCCNKLIGLDLNQHRVNSANTKEHLALQEECSAIAGPLEEAIHAARQLLAVAPPT